MGGYIGTSKRIDWQTPRLIVEAVRAAFGGYIDLDPCAGREVFADRNYRPPLNGLAVDWLRYDRIYCNPPFGRGLPNWVTKCAAAGATGASVILLCPAAVDTRHWQTLIWPTAKAVCFPRGRLRFEGASASAPFATALVYWGDGLKGFREAFRDIGVIVTTKWRRP